MYHINDCWKEFYDEMDPDRRMELFETVVKSHEDDGADVLRKELMRLRYTDAKNSGRKVDNFLWNMIILPGFLRPIYFIKAVGAWEIERIIRELGLENAAEWDEAKRAAAYWEYHNAALRYLSTCKGPNYAKKVFGIMQSNDEEKLYKTAKDFYSMTVTVPIKYGKEKELKLFTGALQNTFRASSEDANNAWNRVINGGPHWAKNIRILP